MTATTDSAAMATSTTERLTKLRELMKNQNTPVDALVVPSEDAHFSEYPAECDKRRVFISGFTGSSGCAVITHDNAYLFTDGRYFLQASQQLDNNWTLMKTGLKDVPSWQEFLAKNLPAKTKIGIDPTIISGEDARSLKETLKPKESQLVPLATNLVDTVWTAYDGKDAKPFRPKNKVFVLDAKLTGRTFQDKLKDLRETLQKKNAGGMVVNMLDEVAWLFNLRGSDINFSPVFFAYALVTLDKAVLFVNPEQILKETAEHLGSEVEVQPYTGLIEYLSGLPASLQLSKEKPIILGRFASLAIAEALGESNILTIPSPVEEMKSIKNPAEVEGFRQSHIRDGVALARYFAWLEEQLNNGAKLNESQVADQLEKYRLELDRCVGLSFPTISSTGPNGAIIHYSPEPETAATVTKDQIYLCDSGAQFQDGTTDVTRTWHFGEPTGQEKRAFTRVLQGHIALDTLVFPEGTTGFIIDAMARRPLWSDGLDYRHGTGHGVGHFLHVHEGPQGIGVRIGYNSTTLKPGMTLSNEPGYYEDGKFGIRIESIVIVRLVQTPNKFGGKEYYGFEHVTMCPIQTKLVDQTLLSPAERQWLNTYHEEVWTKISPLLGHDQRAYEWLKTECAAI